MRAMRLRLLAGVPALLLLASLTACSDDGDSTATDRSSETPSDAGTPSDPVATETSSGAPAGAGACTYPSDGSAAKVKAPPVTPAHSGEVGVTVKTSVGDLGFTLDADKAPCTVNSFLSLAEQGYFDGTTCHRLTVSDGFEVLQCGDPTGTGTGGPGYSFADELSGSETYGAGTLAMANAGPNTNGSQFFVVYGDTGLPPSYTVFGTVDQAGLAAIEKAAAAGVTPQNGPEDGTPVTPVKIESVAKR